MVLKALGENELEVLEERARDTEEFESRKRSRVGNQLLSMGSPSLSLLPDSSPWALPPLPQIPPPADRADAFWVNLP